MAVDNTIHIIGFKVQQWVLSISDIGTGVYVSGVYEENVFE